MIDIECKIGEGDGGCSWSNSVSIFGLFDISYNLNSFRIHFFGDLVDYVVLVVMRDTEEGEILSGYHDTHHSFQYITDRTREDLIDAVMKMLLTNLTRKDFQKLIVESHNNGFRKGALWKENKIKEVLNIK